MSENELVYGIHAVRHTLLNAPQDVLELWLKSDWHARGISEIRTLAVKNRIAIQEVPAATLDKLVPDGVHQGVALRRRAPKLLDEQDLASMLAKGSAMVLFLVIDGIQDPHNLGACLRTADAAGIDAVIVPMHRGVGITPAARKVASGAAETVSIFAVRNLARALREIRNAGIWVVGTADDSEQTIYDVDFNRPTALVIGSEDQGLRRLTREHCDVLARIPMQGSVESLNVSVATGISLFEAMRQRRHGTAGRWSA